jgi:hypothetical protein
MPARLPDNKALMTPQLRFGVGITGHRSTHPSFIENRDRIEASLTRIIQQLDSLARKAAKTANCSALQPRLHALLASGSDLMAVRIAQSNNWEIVAPLPFGLDLNIAINAQPNTAEDMAALMAHASPENPTVGALAADIRAAAQQAKIFALSEEDAAVTKLYEAYLKNPNDTAAVRAFEGVTSDRAAVAARVMIEQSDILIGVWDGVTRGTVGGTRHCISAALATGVPVLWIDAAQPENWRILHEPESLAAPWDISAKESESTLLSLVESALAPQNLQWREIRLNEHWKPASHPLLHAYRRIESFFGDPPGRKWRSLKQKYEPAEKIVTGSAAPLLSAARALPDVDTTLLQLIEDRVLRPFAWVDGVSSYLSDAYRGSMVASFLMSAMAIIGGVAYLPFASLETKWVFATFEFILLTLIVSMTIVGKKRRWHERWLDTRRIAEYLRHAPMLLLAGVARTAARWPRGSGAFWPEWYGIHTIGTIGLPQMSVTSSYLRGILALMRDQHVLPQIDYHRQKAMRLKRAQEHLERLSQILFALALISVALYLAIEIGAGIGLLPDALPHAVAKGFTFLGVLFPTLAGSFAGIHYFGDFERFSAISDITATKLEMIAARANVLLSAPDSHMTYAHVSAIIHAMDDIVISEIENWQAVFSGKHITVPV